MYFVRDISCGCDMSLRDKKRNLYHIATKRNVVISLAEREMPMDYLYQNGENIFDISKIENGELLVRVKVKDFSGRFAYCIEENNLKDYVYSLEQLDKSEYGVFNFSDMDSDSFILFEKTNYGQLKISGRLGMTFRNNYLVFEMDADQTVITNLIKRL